MTFPLSQRSRTMAAFRTIKSRFAGKFKRCGGVIAIGQSCRWAPRAGAYHMSNECPASKSRNLDADECNDSPGFSSPAKEMASVPIGYGNEREAMFPQSVQVALTMGTDDRIGDFSCGDPSDAM